MAPASDSTQELNLYPHSDVVLTPIYSMGYNIVFFVCVGTPLTVGLWICTFLGFLPWYCVSKYTNMCLFIISVHLDEGLRFSVLALLV